MGASTLPPDVPIERVHRARAMRRSFFVLLCAFLAAGLLGLLGVRAGTARAAGGGYELEVRYARVARSGLAAPWKVTVRRPGGFDGPVTLATTDRYLELLDAGSVQPEPESSTADGERVLWRFAPPEEGDTMEVSLDADVGPDVQWGTSGTTAVLDGGRPVVAVSYRTWVLP